MRLFKMAALRGRIGSAAQRGVQEETNLDLGPQGLTDALPPACSRFLESANALGPGTQP